jgi:predicted Ser/Thr protein kinase
MMDVASGGAFLSLTLTQATTLMEKMASNQAWNEERQPHKKERGMHQLKEVDMLSAKMDLLMKSRRFAKDRKEVIRVEIINLLATGFICECKNPVWLANPVLVPKKTGQWRMCIDYTDLNRHCPKDPFPLPCID